MEEKKEQYDICYQFICLQRSFWGQHCRWSKNMLNSLLWILWGIDCWVPWHFVCAQRVYMACSWLMFTQCMRYLFLCVCVCHKCVMNRYAWIYTIRDQPPTPTVTLLCASHDPKGWWLAELPASAILTDWSSMCYTPINGSNYQWARLWTLQTEVNTHNRSWGALRGWGEGGGSISWLKASASHCRSLERSESLSAW